MIDHSEYSFDLMRMFLGEHGILIYVEILIRVVIILSYTMVMIRWIGKRAVGEIGWSDILLVIAMGSAVGDALFYPSIPLLIPIMVITLIAVFEQIYVFYAVKYEAFRNTMHHPVVKIVEHGELLKENFSVDKIDVNEVLMLLRQHGVKYLSEVEHAYFEQSGQLSVFKYKNPEYTNSILPEDLDEVSLIN